MATHSLDITNVDLLWLRKARGAAPLSPYALGDDGALLVSVPDELEVRTFHVARFDGRGHSQIVETYSVETLRRLEIAAGGTAYVGTTDDDLYLFRESRKSRFLPGRRASYTDMALAASGQRFAVAFCDLLLSGHSIGLGDIGGRLLWTKDVPFPVTRVSMDRDGRHIAVGSETGDLLLLDAARSVVWTHRQDAHVTAVATIGPARTFFAGGGGVGAVDADSRLLWFTEVTGELIEIATDAEGKTVAVLSRSDDRSGTLIFLSAEGLPTWDIAFEDDRPTGVSLSPDGRWAAVSLRDGTLSVYALQYGERLASAASEQVLDEARAACAANNPRHAVDLLRARLSAVPSDVAACRALADALDALRIHAFAAAETAEAVGDFAAADNHLSDVLVVAPLDLETIPRRQALRTRWANAARERGMDALAASDGQRAEACFLEAIEADPLDAEARSRLADARGAASAHALARGRELLAAGHFAEAVAALAEAQARGASGPEMAEILKQARIAEALATGNALYQDRQYAAALFQFKKVLRLDPGNAEATQRSGYAQNLLQDTQLSERFTRLE